MKRSLSIIGFGSFGRFMAGHLRDHFEVAVCDRVNVEDLAKAAGVRPASLTEAARAEIIVLCVPVQHLAGLLTEVGPLIASRAATGDRVVVDVSSVKLKPVEMMLNMLPPDVGIIGTHPLFGPQSGKDGIAGLPIALCPARAHSATIEEVRGFLGQTLRLRVVDVSPDEHDRQMAYVQGLTHLLSRALGEMMLPQTPLATMAYERLLAMRSNLQHDSWELFLTIERENPYAADVRSLFDRTLAQIEQRLKGS